MRKIITLGILLPFFLSCYSVNTQSHPYFLIFAGPSKPMGQFGSKNLGSLYSGNADVGEQLNFSIVKPIYKSVGIVGTIKVQRNPFDSKNLISLSTQPGIFNWTINKSAWGFASLLAGVCKEWQINNGVSLISKAMIGAIYIKSPHTVGSAGSDSTSGHYERRSSHSFGNAYLVNLGLKSKISKRLFFIGEVEWFTTTNNVFKDVKTSSTQEYNPSNGNINYISSFYLINVGIQQISSLNINLGIAWDIH